MKRVTALITLCRFSAGEKESHATELKEWVIAGSLVYSAPEVTCISLMVCSMKRSISSFLASSSAVQ